MEDSNGSLSKPFAGIACIAIALFYVSFAPPFPPSRSLYSALSSYQHLICLGFVAFDRIILFKVVDGNAILSVKHWQSMIFPLFLTALMYAGRLTLKALLLLNKWKEHRNQDGRPLLGCISSNLLSLPGQMWSLATNVLFWRNLVVAVLTEELVFRARMIPLLPCGDSKHAMSFFSAQLSSV